jgi:eukaryotic-like serine/threonine-protein kinase
MTAWSLTGFTELRPLGDGGFGRVVLARHDVSGRLVAVKYLFDTFDPAARAQFRHEAAILRLVVSPYVARLFEFVETPQGAAIVMEAVPGVPLRDLLAREPVLAPESALAILKGSLLGLAAAHMAGTVHRDYKPGNVLVQPDNVSKLVDFGIAVLSGHSGLSSGTPAYMAPEQWEGGPATPATDVYAATCVFFQCVTGHRPYEGTDTEALRELHLHGPTPVADVPEPLRPLVLRGMAKDSTIRPASAAAFVHELEAAAHAGYGPDWERRGWQRLAAPAGALLALSPLAFLVSTSGALVPGTTMAAAGGAAGATAGTAVTTGGVLSTVAAKVAAVVIGVGVLAGATAVVVTNLPDDPPPVAAPSSTTPTPGAMRVALTDRSETFDTFTFTGKYAQVSGLGDPALEQRINAQLTAPLDEWIDIITTSTANGPPGTPPAEATVEATVHIQGPKVLSVEYVQVAGDSSGFFFGAGGTARITAVTIDLATGEPIQPRDVFPSVSTDDGAAALATVIRDANPQGLCGDQDAFTDTQPLVLVPQDFTQDGGPLAAVVFTEQGAEFRFHPQGFGYPESCDLAGSPVPYTALTNLMSPEAVRLLT